MSDANLTALGFQREVTWGITPPVCILKKMRFTKEALEHGKMTVKSGEIRDDRQTSEAAEVGVEAKGSVDFELAVGDFDQFFESALMGTFALVGAVPTLTNGTTRTSYTIEKTLIPGSSYAQFTGLMVDQLTLNVNSRQIITAQMSFLGKTGAETAATIDTSGTYADAGTGLILTASANVGNVLEGGAPFSSIKNLTLTINNNNRGNDVIASKYVEAIGVGSIGVTGKMDCYFRNRTQLTKFIGHTLTSISFEVSREAATAIAGDHIGYRVTVPAIRLTKGLPQVSGKDSDLMLPLEFDAEAAAGTAASGVLTLAANAANAETITIGGKAYTAQTVLTNVDGHFLIGADASATIDNLILAITLGAGLGTGSGVKYAALTTAHPTVTASAGAGDTMNVTALNVGTGGNAIATVETLADAGSQFAAATLLGGLNSITIKVEKLLKA